jgi:hypothetical protein
MGHAKVTTTLGVYAHLFNTDDFADAMMALGAMEAPTAPNVIPLRSRTPCDTPTKPLR